MQLCVKRFLLFRFERFAKIALFWKSTFFVKRKNISFFYSIRVQTKSHRIIDVDKVDEKIGSCVCVFFSLTNEFFIKKTRVVHNLFRELSQRCLHSKGTKCVKKRSFKFPGRRNLVGFFRPLPPRLTISTRIKILTTLWNDMRATNVVSSASRSFRNTSRNKLHPWGLRGLSVTRVETLYNNV